MAAYVVGRNSYDPDGNFPIYITDPGPRNAIMYNVSGPGRVITLQLDGDELEAALWGLENYRK